VAQMHPAEFETISAQEHTKYRSEPAGGRSASCCLDSGQKVTFITTCDTGHPQPIFSLAPRHCQQALSHYLEIANKPQLALNRFVFCSSYKLRIVEWDDDYDL
jgi:hypothetical protein